MPRRTEPEPQSAKVGARLRELRVDRDLSQNGLADVTGVSLGQISAIERGLAAVTVPTILQLAKGLGLPPSYLLTFPAGDERAHVMEIMRNWPAHEIVKLRRQLEKSAKAAAKTTAKVARARRKRPGM